MNETHARATAQKIHRFLKKKERDAGEKAITLHLELRFVTCNGAEENQARRCDPYDLRVQEQPLFLVCSSINIFTSVGLDP